MKLFVFIDFSDFQDTQVKIANDWCVNFGLKMILVHKVDLTLPSLTNADARLKIEYSLKREVFQKMEKLKNDFVNPSVDVSYEIIASPLVTYFKDESRVGQGDVFLLGLKGTGKLKQIFIGSTATRLIDEFNQLTITVPLKTKHHLPRKLIVGVHYLTPINEAELERLLILTNPVVDEVEFVTIVQSQSEMKDAESYLGLLKSKFGKSIPCIAMVFSGENAMQKLKDFSSPQETSFLVLQKGSRALVDRVFRKFMINEMVYDASIPLVILPS
ncbi:hypothetical protein ACFSKL_11100 [Belliella marina]|uniref:UspA domain-containing protein n=1 Tax=Belliella marina TaxID=1644146 RepID=A0ABW4VKT8_9BACT